MKTNSKNDFFVHRLDKLVGLFQNFEEEQARSTQQTIPHVIRIISLNSSRNRPSFRLEKIQQIFETKKFSKQGKTSFLS